MKRELTIPSVENQISRLFLEHNPVAYHIFFSSEM